MGISKSEYFSKEQNEMANMLRALGHPARIAIIEHLLQVKTCICGDIVNVLPLAQATISQHIKELKKAGLIKGKISGNAICYCLNEKNIKVLENYFHTIQLDLKQNKETCCE